MRISDLWFYLTRIPYSWYQVIKDRQRRKQFPIGTIVCCCDLKHRAITEYLDSQTVVCSPGEGHYDLYNCIEHVKRNNECHKPYENMESK